MRIRIGTSEGGGTFYSQAVALAELFNRERADEDKCSVHTTLVNLDDLYHLEKGEFEFGLMASNWIGRASNGTAPFTRKIALCVVAPANAGPMFFVTLADSPIKTVNDLVGKRIALGPKGSGMAQHGEAILATLEISPAGITPVYLGFPEGAKALLAGEIDAQWQRPIPNQVVTDLSHRVHIRVVPYAQGQLEMLLAAVPFYREAIIEEGAFRGVSQDIPQIGVLNVIVTHENVPEQAVYDMATTIVQNLHTLPTLNPLFKGIENLFEPLRSQGSAAFEFGGVPLHRGALRAYRDTKWIK